MKVKRALVGLAIGCVAAVGAIEPVKAQWNNEAEYIGHYRSYAESQGGYVADFVRSREDWQLIDNGVRSCNLLNRGGTVNQFIEAAVDAAIQYRLPDEMARSFVTTQVIGMGMGINYFCPQHAWQLEQL